MAVDIICKVKAMGLLFCFYTAAQFRTDCGRSRHSLRTACRCTTAVFLHTNLRTSNNLFG